MNFSQDAVTLKEWVDPGHKNLETEQSYELLLLNVKMIGLLSVEIQRPFQYSLNSFSHRSYPFSVSHKSCVWRDFIKWRILSHKENHLSMFLVCLFVFEHLVRKSMIHGIHWG